MSGRSTCCPSIGKTSAPPLTSPATTDLPRYILGDTGRSYVVGVGNNPPCRPHSRMASCPNAPAACGYEYVNR
jgi:hypothetical protein